MMEKINTVADWFLSKGSMTQKKLQKLCYYAQAWHCALLDEVLFEDRIEAWVHGPVIVSLYHMYSNYGWKPIPIKENSPTIAEESLPILESVYFTYGDLNGEQLENLTHSEQPWIEARKGYAPWQPSHNAISVDLMRKYYAEQYRINQGD